MKLLRNLQQGDVILKGIFGAKQQNFKTAFMTSDRL